VSNTEARQIAETAVAHAVAELYEEKIAALEARCAALEQINRQLEKALNPFTWTREMSDAWHKAIPDTTKAFNALHAAAVAPLADNGGQG
jgi:exonuclease VII small subunit